MKQNVKRKNVELTSTFLLYRGLVHHYHRILNVKINYVESKEMQLNVKMKKKLK